MKLFCVDLWIRSFGQIIYEFYYIQLNRSAHHPEYDYNGIKMGEKCYQLSYLIFRLNEQEKIIFDLGPDASFDEGGI